MEYWLLETTLKCEVDHHSLIFLLKEKAKQKLTLKIVNCMVYLQNFTFSVVHKPGNSPIMTTPDALSRSVDFTDTEKHVATPGDVIPIKIFSLIHTPLISHEVESEKTRYFLRSMIGFYILAFADNEYTIEDIIKFQNNDPECIDIKIKIQKKSKNKLKNFIIKNTALYQIRKRTKKVRLVLPEPIVNAFINYLHICFIHIGSQRLIEIISENFFIFKIVHKCNIIISKCITCLRTKPRPKFRPQKIELRHFESVPWAKVHMDLWDSGKQDSRNKRYLLAITDELTSYFDGEPLASKNQECVAEALLKLILRNGVLSAEIIVSDNGSEWAGIWEKCCKALHLNHIRTTAYFSQSNGKIERQFRELNIKFKLLKMNIRHWSLYFPYVAFIINNSPREDLQWLSPTEAMFGRTIHMPYSYIKNNEFEKNDFLKALSTFIEELHPQLMLHHYERYEKLNLRLPQGNSPSLTINQKVYVYKPSIDNGKLTVQYHGPYTVMRQLFNDSYLLECPLTKRKYRRNIKHIRPIKSDDQIKLCLEGPQNDNPHRKRLINDNQMQNFKNKYNQVISHYEND